MNVIHLKEKHTIYFPSYTSFLLHNRNLIKFNWKILCNLGNTNFDEWINFYRIEYAISFIRI